MSRLASILALGGPCDGAPTEFCLRIPPCRHAQRPTLPYAGHSIGCRLRGSDGGSNPEASLTVLPGGQRTQACVRRSQSDLRVIRDKDRIEGGKSKC